MPSDARQFLFDIATAADAIGQFTQGRTLADFDDNLMLRSACERQFEIIGEAMMRLRDRHPDVFDDVPAAHAIVAFRNRLIHGYDSVDSAIVWDVITRKLGDLARVVRHLLDERS
ncbi:DUF86 domain-containing protein [soil metagenome]